MDSYEDVDFTYGEQPTESKWDQLGLNDKRFNEILTYGWQDPGETWTYASATTFTVSGDVTDKYSVGDKIKLTQTTVKYFYIISLSYSSPNTTITVSAGSDYALDNDAITDNYYSKGSSPVGFPMWFDYTSSVSGAAVSEQAFKFSINGRLVTCCGYVKTSGAGSGSYSFTAPITSKNDALLAYEGSGMVTDVGTGYYPLVSYLAKNDTRITLYSTRGTGAVAQVGINNPMAFANGDIIEWQIAYEI